jgi:hypothetical protein
MDIHKIFMKALQGGPKQTAPVKKESKDNNAVRLALASIKAKDKLNKWKFALTAALKKGNYSFTQLHAMVAKFETAVKRTGNYEQCFLETVEHFGNSDAVTELAIAKKSFL